MLPGVLAREGRLPPITLLIALLGALLGFVFAAVSTYDFVAHLDRQVHGLHCSFLPGMGATDVSGASGCHVTLMSPYSSILREQIWGGIPISLPAMALFAFLLFLAVALAATGRRADPRATGALALFSLLPLLASLVMGTIALRELDAFCKLCVGIYIASLLCAVGAVATYHKAQRGDEALPQRGLLSHGALAIMVVIAALFVGGSTLAYALNAPDFNRYTTGCGELTKPGDQGALITLGGAGNTRGRILEVLDPLCPACRGFERRFTRAVGEREQARSVLLFPLDNSCNWMVDRALHPGACAISEALLCAGDGADEVLAWAFDEQDELVREESAAKGSAAKRVVARFPSLQGCVGSSKARARLNRALRWAVDQRLPVLTPQLYVDGKRLCDADTDLGLDYVLSRMLEHPRPEGR
jgi:uncharacterized membrane protein